MNSYMKKFTKVSVTVVTISSALVLMGPLTAFAATSPDLKTAAPFSITAGAQITNVNPSVVSGNVAGPSVDAGWPPLTFGGTLFTSGLTTIMQDRSDAYDALVANGCGQNGLPNWTGGGS